MSQQQSPEPLRRLQERASPTDSSIERPATNGSSFPESTAEAHPRSSSPPISQASPPSSLHIYSTPDRTGQGTRSPLSSPLPPSSPPYDSSSSTPESPEPSPIPAQSSPFDKIPAPNFLGLTSRSNADSKAGDDECDESSKSPDVRSIPPRPCTSSPELVK